MKKIYGLTIIAMIFFSCTESKDHSDMNLEKTTDELEIAGDGGEINISKVTHDDKPIWIELVEKNDLDKLNTVLMNKDTLNLNFLTYKGFSPWGMKLNQLVSQFDFQKQNENGEDSFWEIDGIKSSFRKDSLNYFSGIDLTQLELYEKRLTEYTIKDFKNLFPKSYSVRNYYFDSYQANFVDDIPKSYDHIVLIAGKSNKYFHFYFINENVADFVFNDDRGY